MPSGPLQSLLELRTRAEDDARVAWLQALDLVRQLADALSAADAHSAACRQRVERVESTISVHRSGRFTVAEARRQREALEDAEQQLDLALAEVERLRSAHDRAADDARRRETTWTSARAERRAVETRLERLQEEARQHLERQQEDEVGDVIAHRHASRPQG